VGRDGAGYKTDLGQMGSVISDLQNSIDAKWIAHKRPNYLPDPAAIRNRVRRVYFELRLNYSKIEIKAARTRVRSALVNHPNRSKFISGKYLVASLLRGDLPLPISSS
jgi:hypothetical protein